jgi:hypothetical protein
MMPTLLLRCSLSSCRDMPARSRSNTRSVPSVGESSPAIKLRSVDLPDPDVPSSPTNSPGGIVSDTPSRALTTVWPIR